MKINLASHYGMCFGVRDALKLAEQSARRGPVTMLGQLVHNPVVSRRMAELGVANGDLEKVGHASTPEVIITAHGAADRHREAWKNAGFRVQDTTCPLVRKAHHALAELVAAGNHPVVIGQPGHVEVRGLVGDFPHASVVQDRHSILALPPAASYGVVSQTTQPVEHVLNLVREIRECFPMSGVIFRDTVCQPTKLRQKALEELCAENELVIVVGGRNSNNSRQLVETARKLGVAAQLVEGPTDLQEAWFCGIDNIGVTAGTSTLKETVDAVVLAVWQMAELALEKST
jgi:4-hydroxy-3-methylbut-2-enyl diphosphate reductase